MANKTIANLTLKGTPVVTDELAIQETGGGSSRKTTFGAAPISTAQQTALDAKVSLTGAESVTGQKTFTAPLATADATAALGLATKQQMDVSDALKAGIADQNVFTKKNKITLANTETGDSVLEVTHGSGGNEVTTVDAKDSGIRVERWLNRAVGASARVATGVQEDALSSGLFIVHSVNGSQQSFALRAGIFIGVPRQTGAGANVDKVAIYGEAQRTGTETDGIWGLNSVTEVTNLNGATIGYEVDMNNKSSVDPGVNPTNSFWGLSIVSGAEDRCGTGIIINRNGAFSNNEWNRGIYIKEVKKIGLEIGNIWLGGVDCSILGNQLANGQDTILFRRFTDASPSGQFLRLVNAANSLSLFQVNINGAIQLNGAVGGTGAAGEIAANAVYDDGTLLTCYVFDKHIDGYADKGKWDGKVPQKQDAPKQKHEPLRKFLNKTNSIYNPLDIDAYAKHWKEKRHLSSMPNEKKFDTKIGLNTGSWIQRLVETVEIQAIHIETLNTRLKRIENNG